MKALVVLALLTAPAVADSVTTYNVGLEVKQQKYSVLLVDHACGDVKIKAPNKENTMRVCAKPTEQGRVMLEIDRRTVDGANEVSTRSVVNALPKTAYTVLDLKVTVDVQ